MDVILLTLCSVNPHVVPFVRSTRNPPQDSFYQRLKKVCESELRHRISQVRLYFFPSRIVSSGVGPKIPNGRSGHKISRQTPSSPMS